MAKKLMGSTSEGTTLFVVPQEVISDPEKSKTWIEGLMKKIVQQKGESLGGTDGQRMYRLPNGKPLMALPIYLAETAEQRLIDLVRDARQQIVV